MIKAKMEKEAQQKEIREHVEFTRALWEKAERVVAEAERKCRENPKTLQEAVRYGWRAGRHEGRTIVLTNGTGRELRFTSSRNKVNSRVIRELVIG